MVIVSEFLRTFHYRPFDSLAHTCERAALEKIPSVGYSPLLILLYTRGERREREGGGRCVGDGLGGGKIEAGSCNLLT